MTRSRRGDKSEPGARLTMHELSLALDLLSAIERNSDRGDARVVPCQCGRRGGGRNRFRILTFRIPCLL